MSTADEIAKLAALRDAGHLSPEEYQGAKAKLIPTELVTESSKQAAQSDESVLTATAPRGRRGTRTIAWSVLGVVALAAVSGGLVAGGVIGGHATKKLSKTQLQVASLNPTDYAQFISMVFGDYGVDNIGLNNWKADTAAQRLRVEANWLSSPDGKDWISRNEAGRAQWWAELQVHATPAQIAQNARDRNNKQLAAMIAAAINAKLKALHSK